MALDDLIRAMDFRGGINDSVSPGSLAENEVVTAANVDFRNGTCGTKRGGCQGIDLTGSVFDRAAPSNTGQGTGSWAVAAGGSMVLGGSFSSVNTNVALLVFVATNAAVVGNVQYIGVNMTLIQSVVVGGIQVNAYRRHNPNLAGGTISVVASAASTGRIFAMYADRVDLATGPVLLTTGGIAAGAPTILEMLNVNTDPTHMIYAAFSASNLPTPIFSVGSMNGTDTGATGAVNICVESKLGMKPKTVVQANGNGSAAWCGNMFAYKGVLTSVGKGAELLRCVMLHSPTNDPATDELWIQDDFGRLDRRVAGVWQGGIPFVNWNITTRLSTSSVPDLTSYATHGVSLHQKFFLATDGLHMKDRMTVWDGTILRWGGLYQDPLTVPFVADSGAAGTYAGTRYFRFRYIEKVGTAIVRRSEPSPVVTFVPSGANDSAVITRPTTYGFDLFEGETHWEAEASTDNLVFYRIAETVLATVSVSDFTAFATGYAGTNPLSAALTEYLPPTAPRHVVVDGDRLLFGGAPTINGVTNPDLFRDSRISWTPLRGDTGVGNDERVPTTARFYQDLDGVNGGRVNHLLPASLGGIFVLKEHRIYKMTRTGGIPAYDWMTYSPARGSSLRGAVAGVDARGNSCIYFHDPYVGPCVLDSGGVRDLMQKRPAIVRRINKAARIVGRVVFYPRHWLALFSVSLDANTLPMLTLCYNIRTDSWTDYTGFGGQIVNGTAITDPTTLELKPYFIPVVPGGTSGAFQLMEADKTMTDNGDNFVGTLLTKAYAPTGFFREFAIDGAVINVEGNAGTPLLRVAAIRDGGLETKQAGNVTVPSTATQDHATKEMDDLVLGECHFVQFRIDEPSQAIQWTVDGLVARWTTGSPTG